MASLAVQVALADWQAREAEIASRVETRLELTKELFFAMIPFLGGMISLVQYVGPTAGIAALLGPLIYCVMWVYIKAHSNKIDEAQASILRAQSFLREHSLLLEKYITHEEENRRTKGEKVGVRVSSKILLQTGFAVYLLIAVYFGYQALA